jgi:hypothetical protein
MDDAREEIRFVADTMLGRLARWLRVTGQDVKYGPHLSGHGLLREARQSKRWILTRDRKLARRKNLPPLILIRSDTFRDQLREVLDGLGLDPLERAFTRCLECNELLSPLVKKDAEGRVPPYIFATEESFVTCRRCRRIYWPKTHRLKMLEELKTMREGLQAAKEGDCHGDS